MKQTPLPKSEHDQSSEIPTLRDQFAMAALTGLISDGSIPPDNVCKSAYTYADAMMEARELSNSSLMSSIYYTIDDYDDITVEINSYILRVEKMHHTNWWWQVTYPNGQWDSDATTEEFARTKQQAMKLALKYMMEHNSKLIKEERKVNTNMNKG